MHGAVLLDAAGEVLRPAILWNDQRTAHACDEIRAGGRARSGSSPSPATTRCPGSPRPKLVWVRDHEPEVWARIAHVLLPKDYVRLRLTGEYALDKADGAGTLLFDLAARDWSPEVLAALGIDPAWMPPTYEGPEVTGTVTAEAAAADRAARRDPGRRRRRRPVGQRGRRRGRVGRDGRPVAGDVRGRLRDDGPPDHATRAARSTPSATRSPDAGT